MIVTERVIGIVKLVRLDLYGHGLACRAKAIRRQLEEEYELEPLPSERTIGRILEALGLTYNRTGWYEGKIFAGCLCHPGRSRGRWKLTDKIE